MVGRRVLRPARRPRTRPTARSADGTASPTGSPASRGRCRSISRRRSGGQRGAGRTQAPVPPRWRRLLRPDRVGPESRHGSNRHRLLQRQAAGGQESALGWRADLGPLPGGSPLDQHGVPGARRERLVAHQGHPDRRARQPAGRAHRAGLAPGGRQRPAPRGRAASGRDRDVGVVRVRADQQLRRLRLHRPVQRDQRDDPGRERSAHPRALAAGRRTSSRPAPSSPR